MFYNFIGGFPDSLISTLLVMTPGGSLISNLVIGKLSLWKFKYIPKVTAKVSSKKNTDLVVRLYEIPRAILLAV